MPTVKDPSHPKAFVKPLPLPIESQTGLKLQRRDSTYLNPELPTRDEVRRSNYERRKNQMATMGFKSASHKPYVGIGDPFYLDHKKLILHALGQWDEVCYQHIYSAIIQGLTSPEGVGQVVRLYWVNYQCRAVLLCWIMVGQGPTAPALGTVGGYLDICSLIYLFLLQGDIPIKIEILSQRAVKPKTTNQHI